MNIGIDIRSLMEKNRTGVGEYTYELLDALFKIDLENQYFLFYNSKNDQKHVEEWLQENVHYVSTKYPNKLFNFSLQVFKFPKLDGFVVENLDYWFSPNINFTALSKNIKQILTIHDLSFEHFPDCYSWKMRLWHKVLNPRKQCERADIILTPSENTRRDVVETYGIVKEKVRVLVPGLSGNFKAKFLNFKFDEVKNKYNLSDKYILFLGTIEPRKNIIGLVEAYKQLPNHPKPNSYNLVIAGAKGWKYESIMKAIDETEGVRYIGYVDAVDKPDLYKLADLFVYPSLYEGFGFPVLEVMASGTPVITSNRSSLPEVAGDAAYLVNPYNVNEITQGMREILLNSQLQSSMVEKGREKCSEFTWEVSAKQFLEELKCLDVNMSV